MQRAAIQHDAGSRTRLQPGAAADPGDQFLARAQRDLMISYPNPSYGRIEIKVTPREGEEMLGEYPNGQGAIFKKLSEGFFEKLSA